MKKFLKIVGLLILIAFVFKGFLYRQTINYTQIGERPTIPLANEKIIKALEAEMSNEELEVQEIVRISREITLNELSFTFQKVSKNPNRVVETGKANCVGYSALFNAVAHYLIKAAKAEDRYQTKHLVGKINFLGVDLHQFFTASFYKDHDYNIVVDKAKGTTILIDPSIDDYLCIGTKQLK